MYVYLCVRVMCLSICVRDCMSVCVYMFVSVCKGEFMCV